MIWIKRILPIIILVSSYYGYNWYKNNQIEKDNAAVDKYSEITALVWVASAKYRSDPDRFLEYRDSLIASYNLNKDSVIAFIDEYYYDQTKMGRMSQLIKLKVDSLIEIEESLKSQDPNPDSTS